MTAPVIVIGGLGLSTLGINFASSAEKDCDELIRQIGVIIEGYINKKTQDLMKFWKWSSKDDNAKKELFKEIKNDIVKIFGESWRQRLLIKKLKWV